MVTKLKRYHLRLSSLFIGVSACALALGIIEERARRHLLLDNRVNGIGGRVCYALPFERNTIEYGQRHGIHHNRPSSLIASEGNWFRRRFGTPVYIELSGPQ